MYGKDSCIPTLISYHPPTSVMTVVEHYSEAHSVIEGIKLVKDLSGRIMKSKGCVKIKWKISDFIDF